MFQIVSERIVYKSGDSFVVECPGIDKAINDDFEAAWKSCKFEMPTTNDINKRKLELQADEIPYDIMEAAVMLVNDFLDTPRIFKESWSPEQATQGDN